jgi:hypothetical protein
LSAVLRYAASGNFSTLSYNIAGIPFEYAGANATLHTPIISCYVKPFDIVNVQEDFNWHADLYNDCDNHPYRTPTTGGIGIGDGINTLSNFPYSDLDRVTWTNRNGADALTPKGFSVVRIRLAEGVYVDVYNLHAQSGTASADLADSVSDVVLSTAAPAPRPVRIVNQASGLCMDAYQGNMADGTGVVQWACNGGVNQLWSYDDTTGMIRSMDDPHFCLDNGGSYANGATLIIWTCSGNNNQRFTFDPAAGTIAVRSYPVEVIDGVGGTSGTQLQTLTSSGGGDQSWKLLP